MSGTKFLISASTKHMAELQARERKIGRKDWIYIPYSEPERSRYLKNRTSDQEHLIGWFSDFEKALLCGR